MDLLTYRPRIALSHRYPAIRMALTTIVMIPIGAAARMILSAHPIDRERNCFVACSPKRVMIGPTLVPMVLIMSDQSAAPAMGIGDEELDVIDGAILSVVR